MDREDTFKTNETNKTSETREKKKKRQSEGFVVERSTDSVLILCRKSGL